MHVLQGGVLLHECAWLKRLSFSEELIVFFLRKGDYIIVPLTKDLVHIDDIKYLK